MSRRGITLLGLAAAGGAGYYLYTAGGDPKVAQKQAEADAHKLSAKVQNELPGRGKEAEKRGEAAIRQAENKFDQATADAKKKYNEASAEAKAKFEESKKEASNLKEKVGTEVNKGIDKFDATVTEGAAKAKSGISSWFGGK